MKNTVISILLITNSLVYTKESRPYLVIENVNNPESLIQPTIELSTGQNITLKCFTNTRNDQGVYWTWRAKQLRTFGGLLRLDGLSKVHEGSYLCVSPKTKLTKRVNVNVRIKRDYNDAIPQSPVPFTLEDILKLNDEFLQKYPADSWNSKINPYEIEDLLDNYYQKENEKTRWNRNMGIIIGGMIIFICILVAIFIVCKRMNYEKSSATPYTAPAVGQSDSDNRERYPLNGSSPSTSYRPIETHIAPYPPPLRTGITVANAPGAECLPPPTYDEALSIAGPSAPHLKRTAPGL